MPSSSSALVRSAFASSPSASGQTELSNAILVPSGDHCGFDAPVERSVIATASPGPSIGSTWICACASSSVPRLAENAICEPSGDQTTPLSPPGVAVSRRGALLPSIVISHRSVTSPYSSYDGSMTETTASSPSGLTTGEPSRCISQTSSWVTGRSPSSCAASGAASSRKARESIIGTTRIANILGKTAAYRKHPASRKPGCDLLPPDVACERPGQFARKRPPTVDFQPLPHLLEAACGRRVARPVRAEIRPPTVDFICRHRTEGLLEAACGRRAARPVRAESALPQSISFAAAGPKACWRPLAGEGRPGRFARNPPSPSRFESGPKAR